MRKKLNIVFAGTPEIAQIVLDKILNHGFNVSLVLTQPDRPKGRGQKIAMSLVKELALKNKIEVFQPVSFKNNPEAIKKIRDICPDVMIVVAYGLILPSEILAIPKNGCINIHVSLLPRHRGAAPIQRVILEGDKYTGVTIMQMDAGLDTGGILLQQNVEISPLENSGSLHDKLALIGADLIIKYLNGFEDLTVKPQELTGVTYAHKIDKTEALINWKEDAQIIERKIRGFNPFPGCYTNLNNKLVKIWKATLTNQVSKELPGTIICDGHEKLGVVCGDGVVLLINEIQEAGKSRQISCEYIHGHPNINDNHFT